MVGLKDYRIHSVVYNKLLNFEAQYIVCIDSN